jgi:amidase
MASDLIFDGVVALSRRLRARELSCRELMQETLRRIERLNPTHLAIISLRDEAALLAEADAADAELARGHVRGVLHGIPQAIKDLATTKGIRTTWGSPLFRDFVPDADSIVVERMRNAGAILIGKTNTPEWGLGSHSYNPVHGTTRNAFRPELSAGGSSGGAAVALALGLLSVADGSDTGGSLRNPAGWNNVFGFRPSYGRVPSAGPDDVFLQNLGTEGPMGTSVEDVAALFRVQAGHDRRAPFSLGDELAGLADVATGSAEGLRIGWIADWKGHMAMEPGMLDLCEDALKRLESIGARIEPVVPDFDPNELWRAWVAIRHWLIGAKLKVHYDDPAKRAQIKPEAIWEIEGSLSLSAIDVLTASTVRSAWYRAVGKLFERYDLLALPTAQCFPFPAEWHWPKEIAGRAMDTYHRWMEVVIGPTMAAGPSISVPAGLDAAGRPAGLQLWGPARGDVAVLKAAAAYERAFPDVCRRRPDGM